MEEERKFFSYCWERMNKIDNLKSNINAISKNYRREADNYNPIKYVRGSKLIDESFIYSNFPELNFSKNLKEWKENQKNGKKNKTTFEDYLSKAKAEMQSAEAQNSFLNWSNGNKNSSNQISAKNSNENLTGIKGAANYFSSISNSNNAYENYQKQNSLNCQTITVNSDACSQNPNGNLNKNNNNNNNFYSSNSSDNKNFIGYNYYSSDDYKENKVNNSIPGNQAAPLFNCFENASLQNLNLNGNQTVKAAAGGYSYNNGFGLNANSSFGYNPNCQFDYKINTNFNNTFSSANAGGLNMNEFYNVNNLNFPK